MLKLTPAEQAWLDEYRQTLATDYPGLVEDIIIYGPHARGVTDPDIELRVLVLIKDGSRETKDAVSYLGHLQAVTTGAVPLIFVYTKADWAERKRMGDPFYRMAAHDGVSVA